MNINISFIIFSVDDTQQHLENYLEQARLFVENKSQMVELGILAIQCLEVYLVLSSKYIKQHELCMQNEHVCIGHITLIQQTMN